MRERGVSVPAADLTGRTVVLSGGFHGAGAAIAEAVCAAGGNLAVLARPEAAALGTLHVEEVDDSGGRGVVVRADLRSAGDVDLAVEAVAERFGGIDACIHNSSVLSLARTTDLSTEAFDLMLDVNLRALFVLTRACLPHLRRSDRAHVLSIAPPLNMAPRWLGDHPAYTTSKYASTVLTLGWSVEFAPDAIAANCLWPERALTTDSALELVGADARRWGRDPRIIADAAIAVIDTDPAELTGRCLLDGEVLRAAGLRDPESYGGNAGTADLFVGA